MKRRRRPVSRRPLRLLLVAGARPNFMKPTPVPATSDDLNDMLPNPCRAPQNERAGRHAATTATNHHGVDLNRNADFLWGAIGASVDPCAQTFKGTGPASEPEQIGLVLLEAPGNRRELVVGVRDIGHEVAIGGARAGDLIADCEQALVALER